jgi:lysophospholipase L1-like esterase
VRKRLAVSLLVAAVFGAVALIVPEAAGAATGSPYYLSLGDSLAQGVQPNAEGQSGITDQGYADDLYSVERLQVHGLKLAKLGCPGETTTTMIKGGVCVGAYSANPLLDNQLDAAVAFLQTHDVALVTIDIGANNVDGCIGAGSIDLTCIGNGFAAAHSDLATILATLRKADPTVPIVGMNYYDPFLAEWLQGPAGQVLALQSVQLTTSYNTLLGAVYHAFSVPVANVESAFQTTNSTVIPFVKLPINVATICALTWMCAPAPVGPNIHARAVGYWLIAATFAGTIGRLEP